MSFSQNFKRRWTLVYLLFLTVSIQALSLTDELQHFLILDTIAYGADSSGVSVSSSYSLPLYYRENDRSTDSGLQVDCNVLLNKIVVAKVQNEWGSKLTILHRSKTFFLEQSEGSSFDRFQSTAQTLHGIVDLWIQKPQLTIGGSLGRYFVGDSISFDHLAMLYEHPFSAFKSNPKSSYALWCDVRFKYIEASILTDRTVPLFEPMHLSKSNGSYKNLPLWAMQRRLKTSVKISDEIKELSLSWELKRLDSERIALSNCLPFISDWQTHHISVQGKLGSHAASIEALTSMGYLYGYETAESNAPRYLKWNDLFIKKVGSRYDFTFSTIFKLGVCGELFKSNSPEYGTVEFYPFSSWSIFKPVKYRFSDPLVEYKQVGLTSNFQVGKTKNTHIGFDVDLHRLHQEVYREQRKIVVLVPIYVDKTKLEKLDHTLLTGKLAVSQKFQFKKVGLNLSMSQLIPFYVKDHRESESGGSSEEESSIDKKIFGGFNAALSLTIPL